MENQEEQLVLRGDAAQAMLESNVFALAVNALVEQNFQQFAAAKLENKDEREAVYYQNRAITDVVGVLRHWVSVRDGINLKNGDIRQEEGMDYE